MNGEVNTYVAERPSFSLDLSVSAVVCADTPVLDFLRKVEDESVSAPSAILFLLRGNFESLDFD